MNKKLFYASLFVGTLLFAQGADKPKFLQSVEKNLSSKFKSEVNIVESKPLSKALSLIVIQTKGERGALIVENDTGRIFNLEGLLYEPSDKNIDLLRKTKKEILAYNALRIQNIILDGIKKTPQIAVSLGNDKNKSAEYMVLDANCPYCKDKIDNIEALIQKNNIKIILVGLLSSNSMEKAMFFYDKVEKIKNDKEKIALLRKVFDRKFNPKNTKTNRIGLEATSVIRQSGIEGVPFSFVR